MSPWWFHLPSVSAIHTKEKSGTFLRGARITWDTRHPFLMPRGAVLLLGGGTEGSFCQHERSADGRRSSSLFAAFSDIFCLVWPREPPRSFLARLVAREWQNVMTTPRSFSFLWLRSSRRCGTQVVICTRRRTSRYRYGKRLPNKCVRGSRNLGRTQWVSDVFVQCIYALCGC